MALGFMRRHRRWLYVFLWLVIAAFIILYIPAFQGVDAGSPGEVLAKVGSLPITVGEFQKSFQSQRRWYGGTYEGRLAPPAVRRPGLLGETLRSLGARGPVTPEARRTGPPVCGR